MSSIRHALAVQAVTSVAGLGFSDAASRNLAALMALIGGAQICALTHRPLYGVFRVLCVEMAAGSSESVIMKKIEELGPECFGPPLDGNIIKRG